MPENSIHSRLLHSFPKTDKEKWRQAASHEIEGKDPFVELSWKNADDLKFFPYYDVTDLGEQQNLPQLGHAADKNSFSAARAWSNVPFVNDADAKAANSMALQHLSQGADGIFFGADTNIVADILLKDIHWSYCSLFFDLSHDTSAATKLSEMISRQPHEANPVSGAFFWETLPKKNDVSFYVTARTNIRWLGLKINHASPANEIAQALTRGVEAVEKLKQEQVPVEKIFHALAFSVPVETDFLNTIAKLKALRFLWYQVAQAYGVSRFQPADLHVHVRSEKWTSKNFEPHSNLLKSTTAAMASLAGGCDSLTIFPQDENNSTLVRMARNVSSILREESHFDKVIDPTAGAYALEVLIREISKKAWNIFQTNMTL